MNAPDDRGIARLREAVETVASDLERRTRFRAAAAPPRRLVLATLGLAGALAIAAVVLWSAFPPARSEVTILEIKIRGRAVNGVVVDDPASGSLVVMPRIPGSPRAAMRIQGDRS